MSDFLQFLNTASIDSLTKLSGVSPALAESVIATRPFDTVEDCLKVRGMGKNILARAQSSFEQSEVEFIQDERALIPVEQHEEQDIVPIQEKPQAKEVPARETKPSFSERLGRAFLWFFRALLRLILIILVIGGLGAAIYYGVPLLYEKFVTPVEQNAFRVNELENEIASLELQLTEIQRQFADANSQLIEANARIDGIEQSVQAHTTTLATLTEMQATLEAQLKEGNDKTLLALNHEIKMTRVLDFLARARLYLAQSNFGLAREDVQSARDLLEILQSETDDPILIQAVERLDMALGNLPGFPVIASGDLEIAWQILMTGESAPTPTPESTPESTATPEATPNVATPSATATP